MYFRCIVSAVVILAASCENQVHQCNDMSDVFDLINGVYSIGGLNDQSPTELCGIELHSSDVALDTASRIYEQCPAICSDEFVRFFSYYDGTLRYQKYFCDTLHEPGVEAAKVQFEYRLNNLAEITETLESCLETNWVDSSPVSLE